MQSSNKFCGAIVDECTVICVCGQEIILDNDYDKSRLIEHSKNSRYNLNNKKKQLGLPGLFLVLSNPKKRKENFLLSPLSSPSSSLSSSPSLPLFLNKPCPGLYSKQINSYINRTPSTYGGAQQHELVGKEMFPNKFSNNIKFDSKQLNKEEILQFNQQIMKATEGIFEQKPVFKGLCYIMLQATECENQDKGLPNLKYSNEFLNFLVILESISLKALDLFHQNLADINVRTIRRYRRISDNVINNPDLCYENVVALLDHNYCKIETYDDIYNKVSDIKQKNAVAKYVRAYVPLPKFLPIIVALIPTRSDDSEKIFVLHQKLIDIAADLELHIISIGSDGAAAKFQTQNLLQATKTKSRVQH
ncbi:20379_t:CDS:2 [Gigaspora margarita]|uniref:20379_t:CDS:1 n=1 Tax=Gigaspora margarita TaxID=4874 RepID=A0ABM8W1M8_GIGMA|nr:20379_t:CDS:2 [Gigaspora margarita]